MSAFRKADTTDKFVRAQAMSAIFHHIPRPSALGFDIGRTLISVNVDKVPRMTVSQYAPPQYPPWIVRIGRQVPRKTTDTHPKLLY
ncbi:hypothetical protein NS96R_05590 [Pseudomonas parafulva]|uniref:Uncharacterized protein n=1 Tax=Pseudomonas parafulva TaxID=157782 RepID=A0AAJ0LM15_9PSED|nr:hypothetical protein NS96R_05590 [Pseudomonas parafulva]